MSNNAIGSHQAVYALHSNVDHIIQDETTGEHIAYAADGAVITFTDDEITALNAKATELNNATKLYFLREERNQKLVETDYWGNPDMPDMTTAQTNYRQALRDITNTYTSLDTVVWPTKP